MDNNDKVLQVAIEDIIPNRFQPRLSFDDASLQELSESIKQHGIIQPLVLRPNGGKYEIIAGERRYKAAKMAGLASVPAVIKQLDDNKSAEVAVVENVQRKDLSAIEEAKSYKALLDLGYMSQEQLAKRMGISQSAMSNKLRLLNLSEEVQNAVMQGKISERHARALLRIPDEQEQNEMLEKIIQERITVKNLDELIKQKYNPAPENDVTSLDFIKNNATDIQITPEVKEEGGAIASGFANEPINLGEKKVNKFFNNLESEEANMEMTEAISPLVNPTYLNSVKSAEPYEAEDNNYLNNVEQEFENNETVEEPEPLEQDMAPIDNDFLLNNDFDENQLPSPIDLIDEIDTLDVPTETNQFNVDDVESKVNSILNQLNDDYEVNITNNKLDNEVNFFVTVREKK